MNVEVYDGIVEHEGRIKCFQIISFDLATVLILRFVDSHHTVAVFVYFIMFIIIKTNLNVTNLTGTPSNL